MQAVLPVTFTEACREAREAGLDDEWLSDARLVWRNIDWSGPRVDIQSDLLFIAELLGVAEPVTQGLLRHGDLRIGRRGAQLG